MYTTSAQWHEEHQMFTTDLVNLNNRNIFKTSLYIYIFQDEKCHLMHNLSLSMDIVGLWYLNPAISNHKGLKHQKVYTIKLSNIGIKNLEFVTSV